MQKVNASEIQNKFPEIWPTGPQLQLINKDTFDPAASMKLLNWDHVTPITNRTSIMERQDTLKVLMGSQELRSIVRAKNLSSFVTFDRNFFQENGGNGKFLSATEDFKNVLSSAVQNQKDLTSSLYGRILDQLNSDLAETKKREAEIIARLEPEIEKLYSYSGVVNLESNCAGEHSGFKKTVESYGFRDYAFYQNDNLLIMLSKGITEWFRSEFQKNNRNEWWEKPLYIISRITAVPFQLIALIVMSIVEKYRTDALYTKNIPAKVEQEIERLHSDFFTAVQNKFIESLQRLNLHETDAHKALKLKTSFQFSLNPVTGFRVRMIDASLTTNSDYVKTGELMFDIAREARADHFLQENVFIKGVSWYSMIMRTIFNFRKARLAKIASKKAIELPLKAVFERALIESRDLLFEGKNTFSEEDYEALMQNVKYKNIKDAIEGLGLGVSWKQVINFRERVCLLVSELKTHSQLAENILESRKKHGKLPFCFPTVLHDDKNVVVFDNLVPIHLIGRENTSNTKILEPKDLRLITGLPELNGKMIAITGQNGGGKTATEVEMINALYQAHAGLPVFAEHFSFNAKDVIAMVFVERGKGSMLQLLMQKLKAIAEEVKSRPNNKIVIVIDELLTGTQEDTGYDIGKKYLEMLVKYKCSVIFVTQITHLAEFAQNNLGALCYYFDNDGSMKKGIGKGNAQQLADQVGLAEFLN